jgi:tocopherol O-methyltransferase
MLDARFSEDDASPACGDGTGARSRQDVAWHRHDDPAVAEIEAYYDATWWDYRCLWLGRRNLAFHFGYHDEGVRRHSDALINANRTLASLAGVHAGSRVLDAGCGVGGSCFWLARHAGASTIGVTLAHSQVVQARLLAHKLGLAGRARFLRADFTRTPFPDASFDVVWALESLCHAPDKRAFYHEAARLLRPGGRIVVAEYMRTTRPLPAPAEAVVRRWLDGWAIPDIDTPDEHHCHAGDAGLEHVHVRDFTERVAPSLRRLYRIAWWTYPLAVTARLLGIRSGVQHANVDASVLQYSALQSGDWCYGVVTATKPRRN